MLSTLGISVTPGASRWLEAPACVGAVSSARQLAALIKTCLRIPVLHNFFSVSFNLTAFAKSATRVWCGKCCNRCFFGLHHWRAIDLPRS